MSVATKFITTTSDKLQSINVVNGQVIALSDRDAWFYDMGDTRHSVVGVTYSTSNLPETGNADTLYVLTDASDNSGIYIYKGSSFVKIASLGETKEFVGASSDSNGQAGLVPAPEQTDDTQVLTNDGNWTTVGNIISKNVASSIEEDNEDIPTSNMVHEYVGNAISGVVQFNIEVVDKLPETSNAKEHTIYLVPSEEEEDQNVKTEYMYINGAWEMIGTTKVDLSGYLQKSALAEALEDTLGLVVDEEGRLCASYEDDN